MRDTEVSKLEAQNNKLTLDVSGLKTEVTTFTVAAAKASADYADQGGVLKDAIKQKTAAEKKSEARKVFSSVLLSMQVLRGPRA